MDWFSWLSRTGLDPSLVYDYGLAFSNNELEEEDIPYLDHSFLQSMGISIAKHRLEILKLARKHHRKAPSLVAVPVSRLVLAIRGMKRKLGEYVRVWAGCEGPSAIVVVRTKGGGYYGTSAWRRSGSGGSSGTNKLKRNRRTSGGGGTQGRLLLTDGSDSGAELTIFAAKKEGKLGEIDDPEDDDGYWDAAGVEEVRWDAMFKDLKPT
ncbi:hypothetical protein MLD38_005313 [Melastoma candidum]|uniref:Uncharacterized protein n=1 Tax=Melastoma candidum TaxID=119954 RepID=A0ACB9S991_9MYRT|nr:hypothetical protein MLD38_040846 [Melastoma candidum]KAI4387485.1 hypothetical protein MLD38_005313 [Melastoma candidum]